MNIECAEHTDLSTAISIIETARRNGKHAYKSKCKHCRRWIIKQSSVSS